MTLKEVEIELDLLDQYMIFYIYLLTDMGKYKVPSHIPTFEDYKKHFSESPYVELYYMNSLGESCKEHCAGEGVLSRWINQDNWIKYRRYLSYQSHQLNVTPWTYNR